MSKNRESNFKKSIFNFVRATFGLILIALAVAAFSSNANAQKGTVVRKKVAFAKGATSATISGSATWGTSYIYTLRANAGQKMTIRLTGKPTFDFSFVVPPEADGEQPEGETQGVKSWSGTLNDSGVYQIVVSHTIDGITNAPFTLKISIR